MKKTERRINRPAGSRKSNPPAEEYLPSSVSSPGPVPGENLSLPEIKELIELISEKQFNEFELERGGFRLRLQKGALKVVTEALPAGAPRSVEAPPAAAPAPSAPTPPPVEEEKLHIITSPIVGTFYRAPSPTSDSFVKLGDPVEVGKTLCIIEAMKLMNEIQSDAMGTVAKIFVENGQPVEYGQPLFGLKT